MSAYLENVIREFRRLKDLADRAIAQLEDSQFFAVLGAESNNSVAIICKHVAGNQRSRWTDFLTTDGEKPNRRRDTEFIIEGGETRTSILERWEQGWETLLDALSPLTGDHLEQSVTIRGEALSVLDAIQRQLSHYAYHVGQIVTLARHECGDGWTSLSIARGKSSEFNAAPTPYRPENPTP